MNSPSRVPRPKTVLLWFIRRSPLLTPGDSKFFIFLVLKSGGTVPLSPKSGSTGTTYTRKLRLWGTRSVVWGAVSPPGRSRAWEENFRMFRLRYGCKCLFVVTTVMGRIWSVVKPTRTCWKLLLKSLKSTHFLQISIPVSRKSWGRIHCWSQYLKVPGHCNG